MVLFVLAAVTALLGNGPLDHHTAYASSGPLHVDYQPTVRDGTGTRVTFHLGPEVAGAEEVRPFLGSNIVEPFVLQQISPQPQQSEATHAGMILTFPLPPGSSDVPVRVMAKPGAIGPIGLVARDGHGVELRWTQWVLA